MEYKVKVIYTDRKTVGLKIINGDIVVRSPRGMSQANIERILEKHRSWIEKAIIRECAKREIISELSDQDIKDLKRQANSYFKEKCEYYASLMGLEYERITITSAKTRFGSCSSKKNISFSYRLMLYPPEARDYVVVR